MTYMAELKKLARHGNIEAQCDLARLYELRGKLQEAVFWYAKAAERGNRDAQIKLAIMYANGKGVEQDFQLAYALLLCLTLEGHELDSDVVNDVGTALSAEQRFLARKTAMRLRTHNYRFSLDRHAEARYT